MGFSFLKLPKHIFNENSSDEQILESYFSSFIALPFGFDGKKFHVVQGLKLKVNIVIFIIFCLQILRLIYSSVKLFFIARYDQTYLIACVLFQTIAALPVYTAVTFNGPQFCSTLNAWLTIKIGPRTAFSFVIKQLFPFLCTTTSAMAIAFLINHEKEYFLIQFLGLSKVGNPLILGPFLLYEVFIIYAVIGYHLLFDGIFLGGFTTVTEHLKRLEKGSVNHGDNGTTYRALQIYGTFLNQGYGAVFTAIKLSSYITIVYGAASAVFIAGDSNRFGDFLASVAVMIPNCLRMKAFLVAQAQYHSVSKALLQKWGRDVEDEAHEEQTFRASGTGTDLDHSRKFLRSCKSIQFSINSLYSIKSASVLSFFSALIDNITSLLITFKNAH